MTKTEYRAYIASSEWQARRSRILELNSECNRCELPRWLAELAYDQDLHVHHKSYKNIGAEKFEDLEVLCRRCHELETFKRSELKSPKRSTCELCSGIHWDYRSKLCNFCSGLITKMNFPDALMSKDQALVWDEVLRTMAVYSFRGFGLDRNSFIETFKHHHDRFSSFEKAG